MIQLSADIQMARFTSVLTRYMAATSKLPDEVLEKKGKDLGIQLFKKFTEKKWGGAGKHPGLARAELDARSAMGKGIKVRKSLLAKYLSERKDLNTQRRSVGQQLRRFSGTLDQWSKLKEQSANSKAKRSNLWRAIVGKELSLRQSGIGVLAASFLWYRTRTSGATGKVLVKNRTGKNTLGFIEKGDGTFRIVGDVPGESKVSERYGLLGAAVEEGTRDMLNYFKERHANIYEQVCQEAMAIK